MFNQRRKSAARRPLRREARHTEVMEPRLLLATVYVSTGGSDAAPGTLSQPLRTIQAAANLAQPGDTVLVRGGVYRESVRPARSGTGTDRITFSPYPGESVTVSGADP